MDQNRKEKWVRKAEQIREAGRTVRGILNRKVLEQRYGIVSREEQADILSNNRGMGTVEVILIIVVLVGLVLVFKNQITGIVNTLFAKITAQTSQI